MMKRIKKLSLLIVVLPMALIEFSSAYSVGSYSLAIKHVRDNSINTYNIGSETGSLDYEEF